MDTNSIRWKNDSQSKLDMIVTTERNFGKQARNIAHKNSFLVNRFNWFDIKYNFYI